MQGPSTVYVTRSGDLNLNPAARSRSSPSPRPRTFSLCYHILPSSPTEAGVRGPALKWVTCFASAPSEFLGKARSVFSELSARHATASATATAICCARSPQCHSTVGPHAQTTRPISEPPPSDPQRGHDPTPTHSPLTKLETRGLGNVQPSDTIAVPKCPSHPTPVPTPVPLRDILSRLSARGLRDGPWSAASRHATRLLSPRRASIFRVCQDQDGLPRKHLSRPDTPPPTHQT